MADLVPLFLTLLMGIAIGAAGGRFTRRQDASGHVGQRCDSANVRLACLEENISPQTPRHLLLLFAIHAKLNIPDGNTFQLNAPTKSKSEGAGTAAVDAPALAMAGALAVGAIKLRTAVRPADPNFSAGNPLPSDGES